MHNKPYKYKEIDTIISILGVGIASPALVGILLHISNPGGFIKSIFGILIVVFASSIVSIYFSRKLIRENKL